MSILNSLFSGVSGLNAFGTGLSVVSNNIANLNTVGYKDSSVSFADILSQNLTGATSGSQVGRGVYVDSVVNQFTQGSFETTGNALDQAIEGNGFFQVKNSAGAIYYTRDGQFSADQNGFVANPNGLHLQGYQADAAGNLTGQVGDINVAATTSAPLATAQVTVAANVNSASTIPAAFSVNNPTTTSNFSTTTTVYDSLGNSHPVSVYFRLNSVAGTGNTWQWFATVGPNDSAAGVAQVQAQGTLTFNSSGALNTASATTYPLASGGFDFSGGATPGQVIGFNLGTSITAGGTGLNGVTQFGSVSAVLNQTQNGYASGSLESYSVDKNGILTGTFTNGQSRTLAQVALAQFNAPQGLTKIGENLYQSTSASGQPIVGAANTAGMGNVLSDSLELSNVDLAQEFVNMIQFQRGFEANSKVITTTNQMLLDLVNIIQ